MGEISKHRPVLLIAAVSSAFDEAFEWAERECAQVWGPIRFKSERFDFAETEYYHASMGKPLYKQFFAFKNLIDPESIAAAKLQSNRWEQQYLDHSDQGVARPVNIDPGYISEAKLVLATTKDRDHRIYLQQGIYGEVTLHFQKSGWQHSRWTYLDYRRPDFQAFFTKCRTGLRESYRELGKLP